MPSLCDIQNAFADAVTRPEAAVPQAVTSHTGARPRKRFDVYRNNITASLGGVLAGRFPAVKRLVGDEYFPALARVYQAQFPPRSPVLMEYGAHFAAFLEGFEPVADTPYLADVARIEWAWSVAYYAADARTLDSGDLKQVAEQDVSRLVLECHPSLHIVSSPYPALSIWMTNVGDEVVMPINLAQGGEDALVIRPDMEVTVRRLPPGAATFIGAIGQGAMLGEAVELASAHASGFDFQQILAGLIRSGAFTGYSSGN